MSDVRKSEQEVWGCACPSFTDSQQCMDLRTHGYSPAIDDEGVRRSDEECHCACHQHEHDEGDDE